MKGRYRGRGLSGKDMGYGASRAGVQEADRVANSRNSGLTVRPASGPGEGLTRALLKESLWDTIETTWALEFYGHNPSQDYGCFSNFFVAPFTFVVPEEFCAFPTTVQERTVECQFSEKAIMLCKAAAMGDRHSYDRISASQQSAAKIKQMGREVQGFDPEIWAQIECSVAYEAVYQKFLKLDRCKKILLATEDWVLAEATSNDANWGTGLDKGDLKNHRPKLWPGTNMLGWALMQVRNALRSGEGSVQPPAVLGYSPGSSSISETTRVSAAHPPRSTLTEKEKAFLKVSHKVRDILKLENLDASGKALDKLQAKKLEGKHDVFMELYNLEKDLPRDSELLDKHEDALLAVAAYFE